MSVCLSVGLSVCPLPVKFILRAFLPPLMKVVGHFFLDFWIPSKKVTGRTWSQIKQFVLENGLKSPRKKKGLFLALFNLFYSGL